MSERNSYIALTQDKERLQWLTHALAEAGELIPADSAVVNGAALIDYSFVTGESEPVAKASGGYICAAGPSLRPAHVVMTEAKATTVIELRGIRIAQTTGARSPAAAMPTPTTLYRLEIAKLARTIRVVVREN